MRLLRILTFLLWGLSANLLFAQNISLINESTTSLSVDSDYSIVRDVNDEVCSLVLLSSDIPGIKFYSNLGVEKVEYDSIQYSVWIPANANIFKLVVPGFPLHETILKSKGNPMAFLFILDVPDVELETVYRENSSNFVSISTIPKITRLRKNDTLFGRTPISINHSTLGEESVFKISRPGYQSQAISCDTIKSNSSYNIILEKFSSRKQFSAIFTTGALLIGTAIYGIQFSRHGEIGYYLSAKSTFKNNFDSYMLAAGINVSAPISNIYLGVGYAKMPDKATRFFMGNGETMDFSGVFLDLGILIRLKPHFIFSIGTNISNNPEDFGYSTILYELSLGLGWAF